MTEIPTQLYVKETAKGNDETQKDLSIPDPKQSAIAEVLKGAKKLGEEADEQEAS